MFEPRVVEEISEIAVGLGVEPAALLAVAQVESGGKASVNISGQEVPLIRWEGHYFYRLVPLSLRAKAVKAGLAASKWGVVKNPKTQQARYNLLARARKIDDVAALKSCSWGLGQVMGDNAEDIGYASVQALVAEAKSGVAGQVRVMAAFIRRNGLVDELQRLDWAAFARRYNGPSYKDNQYDIKMARAYDKFGGTSAPTHDDPLVLRIGARGEFVTELQMALRRAGYALVIDGDFGPATKRAVMNFQRDEQLKQDGVVGPTTWAALTRVTQGVGVRIGAGGVNTPFD